MIIYSYITLKQLIDEVIMRARLFINQENFDWDTMVILANKAIKETLVKTLPYKDWAYITTTPVQNRQVLPRNFLKPIRLLVSESSQPPYREARQVDVKEWYSLTNWQRHSAWNKANVENPMFMLWGELGVLVQVAQSRVVIHIAPNTEYQTSTAPAGTEYYTQNLAGIFEYYSVPNDLVNDGDLVPIPAEFEELVVLSTLLRWISKVGDKQTIVTVQQGLVRERQKIIERFMEKKRTEVRSLDSFVDPVPPVYNAPPPQGEVPAQLDERKQ